MALGEAGAAGSPHRQVIGDGGFHFSSPDSVYRSRSISASILTWCFDNGAAAVKSAVQRFIQRALPRNRSVSVGLTSGRQASSGISRVARAFGAHGERVTERTISLQPLIAASLRSRRQGRRAARHARA